MIKEQQRTLTDLDLLCAILELLQGVGGLVEVALRLLAALRPRLQVAVRTCILLTLSARESESNTRAHDTMSTPIKSPAIKGRTKQTHCFNTC